MEDQCPKDGQPMCDKVMGGGEGLFYFIWGIVWFKVAGNLHGVCVTLMEKVANWLAPVFLAFGPWQILLVAVVPMLLGKTTHESLALYCYLRVGVTYIVAVLLCHICTVVVTDRIFARSDGDPLLLTIDTVNSETCSETSKLLDKDTF